MQRSLVQRWLSLSPLTSDAILYALAAVFALGLGFTSGEAAQWHWGYLACGPYALVALAAFVLRKRMHRVDILRIGLLLVVLLGAVAMPLALEARWRQLGNGQGFAQPEVSVIERAGGELAQGQSPYRTYDSHGHLINVIPGIPRYESFFPYFPLMSLFGLPSAETSHRSKGLTDPRIVMSIVTLLASALALKLLKASRAHKLRVAQVLLALPTGALFLATGGDDMPILALMLLGLVGLQRRSNYVTGVSLGLAAAMKLTAWPMALGALVVSRTKRGDRSWRTVGLLIGLIVIATIAPFAIHSPWAFLSNVFAFPMGLTSVHSPAASPLPGHIAAVLWTPLGHILPPTAFVVGGYFAMKYARSRWPLSLAQLLLLLSTSMFVMICVAPATRNGYLIYPLNLFLWSRVCAADTVTRTVLD